jgi:hypothetical protein
MPATAGEPCGLPRSAVAAFLNLISDGQTPHLTVRTRARMCIPISTPRFVANKEKCLQNVTALSFDYMNQ